jgi:hypothetical protein
MANEDNNGLWQLLAGGAATGVGSKAFIDAYKIGKIADKWQAASADLLSKVKEIDAPSGTGQKLVMSPELADDIAKHYYTFSNKGLNSKFLGTSLFSLKERAESVYDKYALLKHKLDNWIYDRKIRKLGLDPKTIRNTPGAFKELFGITEPKYKSILGTFMSKLLPTTEKTHSGFYKSPSFNAAVLHHLRDYQHLPKEFMTKYLDKIDYKTPKDLVTYLALSEKAKNIGITADNVNVGTIYNKLVDHLKDAATSEGEKKKLLDLLTKYERRTLGVPGIDPRNIPGVKSLPFPEHLLKEQSPLYSGQLRAVAKYGKLGAAGLGVAGLGLLGYGAHQHFNSQDQA